VLMAILSTLEMEYSHNSITMFFFSSKKNPKRQQLLLFRKDLLSVLTGSQALVEDAFHELVMRPSNVDGVKIMFSTCLTKGIGRVYEDFRS